MKEIELKRVSDSSLTGRIEEGKEGVWKERETKMY